jgi:hypothetical protein
MAAAARSTSPRSSSPRRVALSRSRRRARRGLGAQDARVRPRAEAEGQASQFETATVWIDDKDATIRQFEVTERSGLVRRVRLTSFRPNARSMRPPSPSTVLEGVRIVDR